jgi:hypothetical protein
VSETHRGILCSVGVLIAFGVVAISGAWEPAGRLLHRWSYGVLVAFLMIFAASMFLTLRGRLANSLWMIPVSAALAYPAAMLAYVIYFGAFEPQRLVNSIGHGQTTGVLLGFFWALLPHSLGFSVPLQERCFSSWNALGKPRAPTFNNDHDGDWVRPACVDQAVAAR